MSGAADLQHPQKNKDKIMKFTDNVKSDEGLMKNH